MHQLNIFLLAIGLKDVLFSILLFIQALNFLQYYMKLNMNLLCCSIELKQLMKIKFHSIIKTLFPFLFNMLSINIRMNQSELSSKPTINNMKFSPPPPFSLRMVNVFGDRLYQWIQFYTHRKKQNILRNKQIENDKINDNKSKSLLITRTKPQSLHDSNKTTSSFKDNIKNAVSLIDNKNFPSDDSYLNIDKNWHIYTDKNDYYASIDKISGKKKVTPVHYYHYHEKIDEKAKNFPFQI